MHLVMYQSQPTQCWRMLETWTQHRLLYWFYWHQRWSKLLSLAIALELGWPYLSISICVFWPNVIWLQQVRIQGAIKLSQIDRYVLGRMFMRHSTSQFLLRTVFAKESKLSVWRLCHELSLWLWLEPPLENVTHFKNLISPHLFSSAYQCSPACTCSSQASRFWLMPCWDLEAGDAPHAWQCNLPLLNNMCKSLLSVWQRQRLFTHRDAMAGQESKSAVSRLKAAYREKAKARSLLWRNIIWFICAEWNDCSRHRTESYSLSSLQCPDCHDTPTASVASVHVWYVVDPASLKTWA